MQFRKNLGGENLVWVGSPSILKKKASYVSGQSIMNRSRANNAMSRFIGFDLSRGIGIRIHLSSDDEEEDSLHSNTSNASDDQDIEEEHALIFALERQSEGGVRSPELSDISTDFVSFMEPGYNMEDENRHVQNAVNLDTEQLAGPTNPSEGVDTSSSVPEPSLFIIAENSLTVGEQAASTSSPESTADNGRPGDGAPDTGITADVASCPEPSKVKKRKKESGDKEATDEEEDLNGQICAICMDEWSNSGTHRMCCLKCGHIYGESCIRRWLTSASASSSRCPQCNAKAKLRDIRPLFARSLRAIDTAERDRLAEQLESTRREKERLQLEITRLNIANQMHQAEVKRLQTELDQLIRARVGAAMLPQPSIDVTDVNQPSSTFEGIGQDGLSFHFALVSTVEISRDGGCRVAAFCDPLNLMVVSQRSTNPLFPGFGVKKVDALEFRATQFVPAHQKPIRDLAFSPTSRSLLLSASFDCTARLLDVGSGSNAVVATLSAESPLWSCCWDACDPNLLHVGSQGGVILSFDIRNTNAPISRKTDPEDVSPIIALVPIPPSTGRSLPMGGLMSCHLSTCWAHDKSSNESQSMPFDGSFTSLRYEPTTQHFLISSRPCSRAPHVRHHVCERSFQRTNENGDMSLVCNPPVHTFLGGTTQKVLSRSCLVPVGRDLLVAAHQESSSTVALWSVGRGGRVATIPASDPVIDTCPLVVNRETHVALLTEKVLRLYKIC